MSFGQSQGGGGLSNMESNAINSEVNKKMRKLQLYYNSLIKDIKPMIFHEAVEFVKAQASVLTRLLSKEHYKMIEQFLIFKNDTQLRLDQADIFEDRLADASLLYAQKAPAMEAAYALQQNSALKMYDCLVAKIRDHAKESGINCNKCRDKARRAGVVAFPLSIEQLRLQNSLYNSRFPIVEKENKRLRILVNQ